MDLYAELRAVVQAMEARGLDYALCGGIALAIHGAPRATQDIDIMLKPEDLPVLTEVARECGFTFQSLPMDFASGLRMQRFTKLIGTQPFMLDVLFADAPLEHVWAGRLVAAFEGGTIKVVSRDGLITLKLAAGRPQDVADVQRLQELTRG